MSVFAVRLSVISIVLFLSGSPGISASSATSRQNNIATLAAQTVGGDTAVTQLQNMHGLSLSGDIAMAESKGSFDFCYLPPDSFYLRLSIGPVTIERWFDGAHGFQRSAGGILSNFSGKELNQFLLECRVQSGSYVRVDSRLQRAVGPSQRWHGKDAATLYLISGSDTLSFFVDRKSGLPLGKASLQDNIRTEEVFDSLATIHGILMPIRSTAFLEGTGLTSLTTLSAVDLDAPCHAWDGLPRALAPADAVRPPEVIVPVFITDGLIFVPVTFQHGKKGVMLLDSGASANFLLASSADSLGLVVHEKIPARGVAGLEMAGLVTVDSFRVGDAPYGKLPFGVMDVSFLSGKIVGGLPVMGVLGYEFLARQTISVDYERAALRLNRQLRELSPSAHEIPFTLYLNLPVVRGRVNGAEAACLVDLGNAGDCVVHEPFARAHGLVPHSPAESGRVGGIGGDVGGWKVTLATLALDSPGSPLTIDSVQAMVVTASTGLTGSKDIDLNLGSGFLREYIVTLDYAQSRLFLEPQRP